MTGAHNKFLSNKGDYKSMKEDLTKIKCGELVKLKDSVNNQWNIFSDTITKCIGKYFPRHEAAPGNKRKYITPLNENAIRNIKKKNRAWCCFMESRESQHYQTYCKYRNQGRNLTRKVQVEQEKNITEEAKTNTKKALEFCQEPDKNQRWSLKSQV